jgi:hypothetical protein
MSPSNNWNFHKIGEVMHAVQPFERNIGVKPKVSGSGNVQAKLP